MQEVFEKIKEFICGEIDNPSPYMVHRAQCEILHFVENLEEEYNNGWIPVEEKTPDDGDCRFYMCIVENHEEDEPMLCQYEEECGFGFCHDIYDGNTLGFVDSEFYTNEELGYEKVIAWQQIPKYQPKGDKE